jgi:hypothetical protein
MARCKIVFPSGETSQVTYVCAKNFSYDMELGYVEDTDDNQDAFDGTLLSHTGFRKKTFELPFKNVPLAQLDMFRLAWEVGGKIDLYLDGDSPTPDAVVKMMEPPQARPKWVGGQVKWSFDLSFREV